MVKYNKIETVFERDTGGSKKLIEGRFTNSTVAFLAESVPWRFTEKIDGTNIRIFWNGHNVEFGGRTDTAQIPSHLVNKLNEMFMNEETEQLFEQLFGEKEVHLFGEGYGAKIQKGGEYRPDVSFILFDVMIGENYQPRETVEQIAKSFNLEVVPVVLYGSISDAVNFIKQNPPSTIGKAKMEGVVGVPMMELRDRCGKRVIVKIKAKDFGG